MGNKNDIKSILVEQFRELRTNIKYSFTDGGSKVILITSSLPQEGKTTVSSELAITLANDNKKVVIIDCDLRRPSIHKKYEMSNTYGLSEILIKEKSISDVIQIHSKNLNVITSGKTPPNACELLSSNNFDELLDELKKTYDYIILDSPPIIAVTDAQILADKADGTFLVVRGKKTTRSVITEAKKKINNVKGNLLGTILNRVGVSVYNYY